MDSESGNLKEKIDELAGLIEEFGLAEARLESNSFAIAFRKRAKQAALAAPSASETPEDHAVEEHFEPEPEPEVAAPKGTPITSPMTGIYYTSPSPSAPPFVKIGDSITAGQVIGLIEAMKVFNEVTATTSGIVAAMGAENGQIVNPGDVLLLVE